MRFWRKWGKRRKQLKKDEVIPVTIGGEFHIQLTALQPGHSIHIAGPAGSFVVMREDDAKVLLIRANARMLIDGLPFPHDGPLH